MKDGINVLSLFDGISCGMVALERAGIKVNEYYASEIDPKAIKVANHHYPNTIQLGDVVNWKNWEIDWGSIDLLIGGSPCQGFSIAGKKLNFGDTRSRLFFDYLDILNHLKAVTPNVKFLLENVKMPDEIADQIDVLVGAKRMLINSRYFTGHIRKRYYWTNICINEWERKDILLKDIIYDLPYDKDLSFFLGRTAYAPTISSDGIITINPRDNSGKQTWQRGRVYDINGYCPTICASLFDLNITQDHKNYRKLTINECERLQGIPDGYTSVVNKNDAGKLLGNGWTVDVIAHIFRGLKSS